MAKLNFDLGKVGARFERVDLDSKLDYRAEYETFFKSQGIRYTISGTQMLTRSPFREDEKPSFSINLINGTWFDHGTGDSGNFVTFWALYYFGSDSQSCTNKAYKQILEYIGVNK